MQTTKAARISGCLYNLIWLNKYKSTDCKVRIYKTNVRPVLTYASETRAETTYTQQLLRTTEMKIIRAIRGKTLGDKIHSDQLRQLSVIQDIIKWANVRGREWGDHVDRMEENRLAKIVRDNRRTGSRQPRQTKETMGRKSQHSSLVLNSGRTGASLKRRKEEGGFVVSPCLTLGLGS